MRDNPTQRALIRASACRQMAALEEHAATRDAIRPLFRRRGARLAAMISAQPIGERRNVNRRANRAGR
jgi:hypothetical protein